LVIGTGRTPNIPEIFKDFLGPRIFHLNDYLRFIRALPSSISKIGVLGASQSAVEICLDLFGRFPDKEIYSIQRSFGFRLKDTSPFSDRVYFPEFIDYYYRLSDIGKENLNNQLRSTNYSAADSDVINALYMKIYEEQLLGLDRFRLFNNTQIDAIHQNDSDSIILDISDVNLKETSKIELDVLVLATGFLDVSDGPRGELFPPLLAPFCKHMVCSENGALTISRDYRVSFHTDEAPLLFLNGLCEASHGFGDAGSFSLLSLRSEYIASSLLAAFSKTQEVTENQGLLPAL
jgi:L-ornithine N5-monooxygenase